MEDLEGNQIGTLTSGAPAPSPIEPESAWVTSQVFLLVMR